MKLIFVTGGVVSSLGKGIVTASLASLLRSRGIKLKIRKLDPYLNVDPGTMSPYQHGEVYVTDDGYETDLDLGHYERFTDITCSKNDSISSGKIYELAEVVRDLNKGDDIMIDQSYSERQLFKKAYDRLLTEFQIVIGASLEDTQKKIDKALKRNLNKDVQATTSVPEKIEPNPEIIQEVE